jgi:hypothetical protein
VAQIDFLNHYSPVLFDKSFRIILTIIQKMKLPAWSLDIEAAFLNGELREEIFMKFQMDLKGSMGRREPKVKF